jgi:hypothetical protein
MIKRPSDSEFVYKYLALDVKGHQRIYLENADAVPDSPAKSKTKLFGVSWRWAMSMWCMPRSNESHDIRMMQMWRVSAGSWKGAYGDTSFYLKTSASLCSMDTTRHGQFGYDGWGLCWGRKSAELFPQASQPAFSDCMRNLMFGKHNTLGFAGFAEVKIQTLPSRWLRGNALEDNKKCLHLGEKSRCGNAFGKVCVPDMNLVVMSINVNLKTHSTNKSKSNPNLVVLKRADHPAHRAFSVQKEKSDSLPSFSASHANQQLSIPFVQHLSFDFAIVSFSWIHFTNLLDLPSWALLTVNNTSYTFGHQTPGLICSILCLVRYQRYNISLLSFRRNDLSARSSRSNGNISALPRLSDGNTDM